MHTSAFALVKNNLGLSMVELTTPPLAAEQMAEWIGEERNMEVHNLDTDDWVVRVCMDSSTCYIFIDAERRIPAKIFAEVIGSAVSEILGSEVKVVEMPRNATKH